MQKCGLLTNKLVGGGAESACLDSESNHWFTSSHESICHGKLVVAIGSRVFRKTVNSVSRGLVYPESGKSQARQQ